MPEQQQETLKVYELAKELGLDSFALLDKLKQFNIEVKSHMSSLAAEQAQTIRDALRKEKRPAGATSGAVKKRASASSAAATAAAPAKPAKKEAAAKKEKAEPAKAAAPTARKIIKRRTGAESEVEQAAPVIPQEEIASPVQEEIEEAPVMAAAEEVAQPVEEAPVVEAAPVAEEEPTVAPEAEAAKPAPAAKAEPAAPQPKLVEEFTPRTNAPGTRVTFRTPGQAPVRTVAKDEMSNELAPRRLKIVQAAPPPSATPRPGAPTYRTPGAPPEGRGPRHRTGGAAGEQTSGPARPAEMFQPMTSYVAKEDEARNKNTRGGATTRGPTPEEIRIADFRKRELVFQPKRKKLPPGKQVKRTEITEMAAHKKKIRIEDKILVSDLAQRMGEKNTAIMTKLMALGVMAGLNQTVDFDTATIIAQEFGWEVENIGFNESEILGVGTGDDQNMHSRPPIITVMGHVDHGKTSLLDAIRNADVASGEAGGITQHIGAYSVMVDGKPITFLDTPGHEAFMNMRSRGANLTDIVVLVVAADDSIMPQTREAIKHAQTAGVPIIVAANKIDKPAANLEKVKKDLSINNVLVEEWGGEVPLVAVSATKKTGIQDLLETIKVQAEVLELKANPDRTAEGVVLEARMEKGRGIVVDLLVDKGTLRTGDYIVVGTAYGRVRAMTNDRAKSITEVLPGFPAEVLGLNDVPSAGDTFNVVTSEEKAREVANSRRLKAQEEKAAASAPKPLTIEQLMAKTSTTGAKELNVLVKADVFGSAEAIKESIEKIESEKVKAKVIQNGVGVITENDVLFAKTSGALILGFNSKPDNKARDIAKREKVDIRYYTIIYQLLDDVKLAMEALLEPLRRETPIGRADVKQVFTVSKLGTVAGSVVAEGKIVRNAFARVTRGKDTVAEGKIVSLKRFKDDASETIKGQECGIGVENFEAYLPGDVINVFQVELVKQTL